MKFDNVVVVFIFSCVECDVIFYMEDLFFLNGDGFIYYVFLGIGLLIFVYVCEDLSFFIDFFVVVEKVFYKSKCWFCLCVVKFCCEFVVCFIDCFKGVFFDCCFCKICF